MKFKLNLAVLSKVVDYASTAVDAATALNHDQTYKHKDKVTKALNVSQSVLGVGKVILGYVQK